MIRYIINNQPPLLMPACRSNAILPAGELPSSVVTWPGIEDKLADKARKLGIPIRRFDTGGA